MHSVSKVMGQMFSKFFDWLDYTSVGEEQIGLKAKKGTTRDNFQ